jgi:ribosomal protein L11 methyltransferase
MLPIRLRIRKGVSEGDAQAALEGSGITIFSSMYTPENDELELYGCIPTGLSTEPLCRAFPDVLDGVFHCSSEIDWASQWAHGWALHGHQFQEGHVHLDLQALGFIASPPSIRLKPGPGFGDFSHPTTRLALQLLSKEAPGAYVIDIGSGSGILTLAAIALGANNAIGLEIDSGAIAHGQANAQLNRMEGRVTFLFPHSFSHAHLTANKDPLIVVMNMIHSEQLQAWASCHFLHGCGRTYITSGILQEERAQYLEQCQEWGWQLDKEIAEKGWLAFMFKDRPTHDCRPPHVCQHQIV